MDILLSKEPWEFCGYFPWVPIKGRSMETGEELIGVTDWMPATVPGGVHYDLYRHGWLELPYRDLNTLKCEWVENRWWVYRVKLPRPQVQGRKFELEFKGLDYEALIYMNRTLLGEHEGMYHPAVFDVTDIVNSHEELEIKVVFKQAPDEMAQIGKTSLTHTQKSRFNYKWDFSTRLVNIGIWQDVVLRVHQDFSLDDVAIHTDVSEDGEGLVRVRTACRDNRRGGTDAAPQLELQLVDPQGRIAAMLTAPAGQAGQSAEYMLQVDRPELWYPNGYGAQPLYELRLRLLDPSGSQAVLDERMYRIGIRKLEYARNEGAPEDSLPYTFIVNGRKIYIKGVNMTPLDHLYGNVTTEQYEWQLFRMKRAHMNMVRVWGGGLIETERFYELCDKHGLLVWQEFIQSSSGIDNVPSKLPKFLRMLEKTAVAALKERRNHVSLTVWSGGNELMSAENTPSTYEDENLAMLKQLVEKHDPERLFLPTSASGPVEFINRDGTGHDVHGAWRYDGNPNHYSLYGESSHLFHSEFGVDGVANLKSLRKFLDAKHHYPTPMRGNVVWRHHGEWWGTFYRDKELFGEIPGIVEFVDASQWIQAEGLRFIIEANARRQFRSSGSIIWQINEPWPNSSCTNLIDYYGDAKMAYSWTQLAFAPVHASLDYRSLNVAVGETFKAGVWAVGNGEAVDAAVTAEVLDATGKVLHEMSFNGEVPVNRAQSLGDLSFTVDSGFPELFFVRLTLVHPGASAPETNLYAFSTRNEHIYAPALDLKDAALQAEPVGDWTESDEGCEALRFMKRKYRLTNIGTKAALHIRPEETTNAYWIHADRAFETLFPGESTEVEVLCARKNAGGFLTDDQPAPGTDAALPEIRFYTFCENR